MGFLGSIGHFFTGAVNSVVKTVTSPSRLTSAILTGGASVIAPKTFAPLTNVVQSTLFNPALAGKAIGLVAGGGLPSLGLSTLPKIGAPTMGLNLGSIFGGITSGLGTLLGGGSPSQALSSFSNFLPSLGSGSPFGGPTVNTGNVFPTMSVMPAAGRAVATVGRSFFSKYPNLATAIQGYRNMGKKVTRAKLYSLVKRFGADVVISGGILSAAAVSELLVAGPGRRRMNPANVHALRRSVRRLESFHHLCMKVDKLRRPNRSTRGKGARSAPQFVRQG